MFEIAVDAVEAGEDAFDVSVDSGCILCESEGGDCVSGIIADAWNFFEFPYGRRERSVMMCDEVFGAVMEVVSASVVSESGPYFKDVIDGSVGEVKEVWEALHPAQVVGFDGDDLSLLEHDFGDPDFVGCRVMAPGEVASVGEEPVV